jgi:cold shock CspA family protein
MENKLVGKLYSFLHTKGFGFIIVPDGSRTPQKFFLHVSRIVSGSESVAVGSTVRFSVSPIKEGSLPAAIDAEIVEGARR